MDGDRDGVGDAVRDFALDARLDGVVDLDLPTDDLGVAAAAFFTDAFFFATDVFLLPGGLLSDTFVARREGVSEAPSE